MNQPNEILRWASKYPELGLEPIPVEPCISPEYFEKEKEQVFMKTWLKVGRIEEIARPGEYKVKKVHFAKTSVILIHGTDGKIRGFHNTCSHRGNKVVVETGEETFGYNKAGVVTCRFHGWVYNSRGELALVPEQERFAPDWNKDAGSLTPVHTDVWEGFIFINLAKQPERTLKDYLAGIGVHLQGYPYSKMDRCFAYHTTLDCNWKIALDAFSEAYHVTTLHAGSFPNVFSSGLSDVALYNEHRTTGICLSLNATPTPPPCQASCRLRF